MKNIILTFAVFFFSCSAAAQSFTTLVYSSKEGVDLELDFYPAENPEATLIFVHGGGFYSGTRKEENIMHFCDSLAQAGINVVNMSYRLHLVGQSFHCDQPVKNKIRAIEIAAEDILSATEYLSKHAEQLQIDPEKIVLMGSSAGAEAALYAKYNLGSSAFSALISCAGAATDMSKITKASAIPTLLFHGTCDALVPYDKGIHHYCPESSVGALYLFGSYTIYRKMVELDVSVELVTACGGKHGSAVTPLERDIPLILEFIRRANSKGHFTIHEIRETGRSCSLPDGGVCND
ncbi:MAG: alpha/beta hydrolase fold domain-containing protein [Cryomorphaceae bacterium]|nr:alpha/beta hydrolase fold domain-containing protein [Cryomorphaceae bacterium]